jgi:hypothetical protein
MFREPLEEYNESFPGTEPLPRMIRRIVREELRPIEELLEELRDRSNGSPGA